MVMDEGTCRGRRILNAASAGSDGVAKPTCIKSLETLKRPLVGRILNVTRHSWVFLVWGGWVRECVCACLGGCEPREKEGGETEWVGRAGRGNEEGTRG